MSEDFSKFLSWLIIFAFVIMFWEGFTAEMSRSKNISNVAKYNPTPVTKIVPVQQNVYRQVYVNNLGGPATVYYIRQ
jgi:hypothetical protein